MVKALKRTYVAINCHKCTPNNFLLLLNIPKCTPNKKWCANVVVKSFAALAIRQALMLIVF